MDHDLRQRSNLQLDLHCSGNAAMKAFGGRWDTSEVLIRVRSVSLRGPSRVNEARSSQSGTVWQRMLVGQALAVFRQSRQAVEDDKSQRISADHLVALR
jgi:hypothetical protein